MDVIEDVFVEIPYCIGEEGFDHFDQKLLEPCGRSLRAPKVVKDMMQSFNHWLKVPENISIPIVNCALIMHNSMVMVDNLEETSQSIYPKDLPQLKYGLPWTLNAALYGTCIAVARLVSLESLKIPALVEEEMQKVYRGQGMEIYWRNKEIYPTIEECEEATVLRTGHLFVLCARMMDLFSENKTDCTHLAKLLGLYHQIYEDYRSQDILNVDDENSRNTFIERPFNYPLINALHKLPKNSEVLKPQENDTFMNAKYRVSVIRNLGGFECAKKKLQSIRKEIEREIKKLGGNPELEETLKSHFKF